MIYVHHSLSLAPMLEHKALFIKVFASAGAGSYGMEMEFDLARAQKDIPGDLRKSFQELQNPKPLRGWATRPFALGNLLLFYSSSRFVCS